MIAKFLKKDIANRKYCRFQPPVSGTSRYQSDESLLLFSPLLAERGKMKMKMEDDLNHLSAIAQ